MLQPRSLPSVPFQYQAMPVKTKTGKMVHHINIRFFGLKKPNTMSQQIRFTSFGDGQNALHLYEGHTLTPQTHSAAASRSHAAGPYATSPNRSSAMES